MRRGWLWLALALCGCDARFDFGEAVDAGAIPGACTASGTCGSTPLVCDPAKNTCVECLTNAHCPAAVPACDPVEHRCVQCNRSQDCGAYQVCELTTHRCLPSCFDLDDCPRTTLTCVSTVCAQCLSDEHCRTVAGAPRCDLATRRCVACSEDAHCGGATPVCDRLLGRCVGCVRSTACDPEHPYCAPATHSCVAP